MDSGKSDIALMHGLFIVLLTVIFGANVVAIKLALTGMGPLTTAGCRFALAAAAIAGWAWFTGRSFTIQPGQWPQVLIISAAFTLQLCLFYLGIERTYASRGVLISNLLPFFVLFLSHRFIPDERITPKKLVGILLGFAGVAVLFAGRDGIEHIMEAQRVVVAIGIRPDDTIHRQIKSLGYETHVIGDCLEPRTAKTAIYEGAKLGRSI